MITKSCPTTLDSFQGDFGALAAMIQQSWAENAAPSLLYSEDFLRAAFSYPGSSFNLAPTAYGDDGLLGFVAGFPRTITWRGKRARIILNSFLTASTDVKGSGIGLKLWAELVRRCRDAGYDGTINFCVEGDDANKMMPGLCRFLKLNTERIFSIGFLTRLLRPAAPEPQTQASEADIDLFMDLASALPSDLPLVRLWTRAEAEWQCRERDGAITVSSRRGTRRGILTGYITQAGPTSPTTIVLLDDMLWGDLEPAERSELLERFLRTAASRGARIASCPILGYWPVDVLTASRFRRSNRVLHTYLTFWNGLQAAPISAMYIDVF